MPDPTVSLLTSGTGSTTTTTPTFAAQTAGTLLFLAVCSDDYRTTSGSNRPESSGWTLMADQHFNAGHATWWKSATGSEVDVSYTIGSSTRSSYAIITASNIDTGTPFGTSSSNQNAADPATSITTPAVTPTAGSRWLVLASTGAPRFSGSGVSVSSWSNSYTEIADVTTGSGTTENVAISYLILDGGTSTSTTATFAGSAQNAGSAIGSFKVAAGGGTPAASFPPVHPAVRLLPILAR